MNTTTRNVNPVTITLSPEDDGRIRITVTGEAGMICTRSTSFNDRFVAKVERYLRESGVYRATMYRNDGPNMIAQGHHCA